MSLRMIGVRVAIRRYISDEPQPGMVECEFTDVHGRRWLFVEKTAIVGSEDLHAQLDYPRPGVIGCEIVGQRIDAAEQKIMLVETERPWGVESVEGSTRFEVFASSLVEWDWDDKIERPWVGQS